MHTGGRIAFGFCRWLLRLFGVELAGQPQRRDGRGRFATAAAASRPAYPPDLTELATALLEHLGVSPKMYKEATSLTLPDDLDGLPDIERTLRHWVLRNMERWIEGKSRSPGVVFSVLERTWALDRLRYAVQLSHAKAQAAALPPKPKVRADQWVALYTPRAEPMNESGGTGPRAGLGFSGSYVAEPLPRAQGAFNAASRQPRGAVPPNISFSETSSHHGGTDAATTEMASDPSAISPQPLAIAPQPAYITAPRYDPDYDVVAGLPRKTKDALCPAGYRRGFGNDTLGAAENYLARNKAEFGSVWSHAYVPCRVYEDYDSRGRSYFVAQAAFDLLAEQSKARLDAACTVIPNDTEDADTPVGTPVRASAVGPDVRKAAVEQSATDALQLSQWTEQPEPSHPNLCDLGASVVESPTRRA